MDFKDLSLLVEELLEEAEAIPLPWQYGSVYQFAKENEGDIVEGLFALGAALFLADGAIDPAKFDEERRKIKFGSDGITEYQTEFPVKGKSKSKIKLFIRLKSPKTTQTKFGPFAIDFDIKEIPLMRKYKTPNVNKADKKKIMTCVDEKWRSNLNLNEAADQGPGMSMHWFGDIINVMAKEADQTEMERVYKCMQAAGIDLEGGALKEEELTWMTADTKEKIKSIFQLVPKTEAMKDANEVMDAVEAAYPKKEKIFTVKSDGLAGETSGGDLKGDVSFLISVDGTQLQAGDTGFNPDKTEWSLKSESGTVANRGAGPMVKWLLQAMKLDNPNEWKIFDRMKPPPKVGNKRCIPPTATTEGNCGEVSWTGPKSGSYGSVKSQRARMWYRMWMDVVEALVNQNPSKKVIYDLLRAAAFGDDAAQVVDISGALVKEIRRDHIDQLENDNSTVEVKQTTTGAKKIIWDASKEGGLQLSSLIFVHVSTDGVRQEMWKIRAKVTEVKLLMDLSKNSKNPLYGGGKQTRDVDRTEVSGILPTKSQWATLKNNKKKGDEKAAEDMEKIARGAGHAKMDDATMAKLEAEIEKAEIEKTGKSKGSYQSRLGSGITGSPSKDKPLGGQWNEQKEKKDLTKQNISYKMLVETIEEEMRLMEQANTLGADVNEILMGYYAGGGNWGIYGPQAGEAQKAVAERKAQISPEEYADQDGRAQVQAKASLEWAAANGFDGKLVQTWWTARPGVLAKAVETEVDSRKNPTDTLYKFSSDAFLGVSAKSTKGGGDIGFKNPGIGRLGKDLGVDLAGTAMPMYEKAISELDWGGATGTKGRKQYLKQLADGEKMVKVPEIRPYYEAGTNVLRTLRDALMKFYLDMDIDELKEHFLDEWIDAKDRFPYYIKVTGHGKNGNYTASILDPINNEKVKRISSEHIELEEIGSNSIGVWAGEGGEATKLFKIRFKWESAPLASSIKMSGDPF